MSDLDQPSINGEDAVVNRSQTVSFVSFEQKTSLIVTVSELTLCLQRSTGTFLAESLTHTQSGVIVKNSNA